MSAPAAAPKVSVVIPAYGQEKYLAETLDSLLQQNFAGWEALVIDDGSPDRVREVAERYAAADGRIRFIHTDNGGVAVARNRAAAKARGKYLLFVDGDDVMHSSYLGRCVSAMEGDPYVVAAYSQWRFFGITDHTSYKLRYLSYRHELIENTVHLSAMMLRSRFEQVGGFDEDMRLGFEDWEFWIRYLYGTSPAQVVFFEEPLFGYRQVARSRNSNALKMHNRRECYRRICEKHREKYVEAFGPDFWFGLAGLCDSTAVMAFISPWPQSASLAEKGEAATQIVQCAKWLLRHPVLGKEPQIVGLISANAKKLAPHVAEVAPLMRPKDARRMKRMVRNPRLFAFGVRLAPLLKPKNWFSA